MVLHQSEVDELRNLEESLWRVESRFDLVHQEKVFAQGFFEFGRSGRVYTREQMVRTIAEPIDAIPSRDPCF